MEYKPESVRQLPHAIKTPHFFGWLNIDRGLLLGLLLLMLYGLVVLASASNASSSVLIKQGSRMIMGLGVMWIFTKIPPARLRQFIPYIYALGILLLVSVLIIGHRDKGAVRWLNLGLFRFQPSEFMKIAVPIMVTSYLSDKTLPPRPFHLVVALALVLLPTLLIAKQPDLGTAVMIVFSGIAVIFLAGIRWKLILTGLVSLIAILPFIWHFMHSYQKQRILTFLNPNRDPLGAGYHIIQSKIAIGSGGFWGKGWFHGTQSHLDFLPEHSTDFIFSVLGEEFGLIGALVLISLYCFIVLRAMNIAFKANDTFNRLLAGSLAISFFMSAFVNIGMVCGILPVVGIPLPLVSYGGTSAITLLTGFGIILSVAAHKHVVRQ